MELLERISEAVWGFPTAAALLTGGAVICAGTGFVAFRRFGFAVRRVASRIKSKDGESSFEALCTALAGTVGVGNIAGVAAAIAMGGPGAVFWMWVSAFVGMGTKFAEIVLAVKYREKRGGEFVGGPMYVIKNGLGRRFAPLAAAFSLFGAIAAFGTGNMLQMGSAMTAVGAAAGAFFPGMDLPLPSRLLCGAGMALLCAVTCRDRGRTAARVVPVMAGLYILGALAVVLANARRLPEVIGEILAGAFSLRSGASGAALSWGLRRGLFSNEAGLGSSPISHASADTASPVEQGLWGIFEVFVDTIVLCTVTAFLILTSGVPVPRGVPAGAELAGMALGTLFGPRLSAVFLAGATLLFAYTSILGWSLYGERCAEFLWGGGAVTVYRSVFIAAVLASSAAALSSALRLADIMNALMLIPNMASLLLLLPVVRRETHNYFNGCIAPRRDGQTGSSWKK